MKEQAPFQLSTWQRQALDHMLIDAWYLTPLARQEAPKSKENQALLTDLVGALTVAESPPTRTTVPDTLAPAADTIIAEKKASTPKSVDDIGTPLPQKMSHAPQPPKSITLDATIDLSPPSDTRITLPATPISPLNWDALLHQSEQLAASAKKPCFHGVGERIATELCVFPPPMITHKLHTMTPNKHGFSTQKQQLLDEMLLSIGVEQNTVYRTRVIKHATAFGQDPDDALLQSHLTLLATEVALVQPQRIWLFGGLPCHTVLQTQAPLSALVRERYQLIYQTSDHQTHAADIVCLPTLDYLLALPSEKGKVWRLLRNLA